MLTDSTSQVQWRSAATRMIPIGPVVFCCLVQVRMAAPGATSSGNVPPPSCTRPNTDDVHSCPANRAVYPEHQDPGLQASGPHPGPSTLPQLGVPPRPVFYVPAPPPPPLLPYQWPLPFSFNSFPGFPGMGQSLSPPSGGTKLLCRASEDVGKRFDDSWWKRLQNFCRLEDLFFQYQNMRGRYLWHRGS